MLCGKDNDLNKSLPGEIVDTFEDHQPSNTSDSDSGIIKNVGNTMIQNVSNNYNCKSIKPTDAIIADKIKNKHQFHKLNKIAVDNDIDNDSTIFQRFFGCNKDDDETMTNDDYSCGSVIRRAALQGAYSGKVYLQLSVNDAKQSKISFCLGFFSVFVVVVVAAMMFTTLDNLQMLFLRLGEAERGQMDLVIVPGGQVDDANSLNYTKIKQLFPNSDDLRSYHCPRIEVRAELIRLANPWSTPDTITHCAQLASLPPQSTTADIIKPVWGDFSDNSSSSDAIKRAACHSPECLIKTVCGNKTNQVRAQLIFIDFDREERMGLGDRPPYIFTPDDQETVVVEDSVASSLNATVGDRFLVFLDPSFPMMQAYQIAGLDDLYEEFKKNRKAYYSNSSIIVLSLRIGAIVTDSGYKLDRDADDFIFLNYVIASKLMASGLNPNTAGESNRTVFKDVDPELCASSVIFNLPPSDRVSTYTHTDYAQVRTYLYQFSGTIIPVMGFNQVDNSLPILGFLFTNRFFSLFLGLILAIIIAALSFLSIILIYSLLTVNVENRTFELGVMRMVGYTKINLTGLVITNALLFAIPAWVLGLVFAQLAFLGVRFYLGGLLGVELDKLLSPQAVGLGTLAGLGIPLIAAIAPITTVLTQSLPDALNTERAKVNAIHYRLEREQDSYFSFTAILMGLCLAMFGFLIYYLFPLALLQLNISLLFFIFFGVLLGLLAGLILLAMNFERFAEAVVTYLFFFWENDAVFSIIEKNLITHRLRNRKTSMMYALSLGFVIFITVAFDIQILSLQYGTKRSYGNEILLAGNINYDTYIAIESVIADLKDQGIVSHYVWTSAYDKLQPLIDNSSISTLGRFVTVRPYIRAVSPNIFIDTNSEFLIIDSSNTETGYSIGEQLYTPSGSASMVLPTTFYITMNLKVGDVFIRNIARLSEDKNKLFTERQAMNVAALVDSSPILTFSKYPNQLLLDSAVSLPFMVYRSLGALQSITDVIFHHISVGVTNADDIEKVKNAIRDVLTRIGAGPFPIKDIYATSNDMNIAKLILQFFFIFTQLLATIICFFALLSSMSTNVLYQAKEIGVMRCLGLKKFPTYRIYVWEAFILITSASIMGLVVGTFVAYTMLLQNSLFTQLPLPFTFPWLQLVIIVGTSAVCALGASYGPVRSLLNSPSITHILKRTI